MTKADVKGANRVGGHLIEAHGLSIGYGKHVVLRDLDLAFPAGECCAIVGRNGSGKTTLLHTLAGLRPALQGTVAVQGRRLPEWPRPELARILGFLPQHLRIVFPFTVEEFVAFGRLPWRRRTESGEDAATMQRVLQELDLAELRQRSFTQLSGGEAQRACLAQVLAQDPRILLLDEPLAHLDLLHQLRVMRLLERRARQGRAVVVVLHDLGLAWRLCDRFLVLGDGGARSVASRDGAALRAALQWAYAVPFGYSPEAGPLLFGGQPSAEGEWEEPAAPERP